MIKIKLILFTLLILLFSNSSFAISGQISSGPSLNENNNELSSQEVINNFVSKEVSEKVSPLDAIIQKAEKADYKKLVAIYKLDVFQYFNLSQYDTDLKKSAFKKSDEYKDKLILLKAMKLPKKQYFIEIDCELSGWSDSASGSAGSLYYNMKKKGFEICLGSSPPQGIVGEGYEFKSLPLKYINAITTLVNRQVRDEILFIPIKEDEAIEIENGVNNIKLYLTFRVKGTVNHKIMSTGDEYFNNPNYKLGYWGETQDFIIGNPIRVVLANINSGKVYYDKTY